MAGTAVDSACELEDTCSVVVEGSVVVHTAAADIAADQESAILAVEVVGTGDTANMAGDEAVAWVSRGFGLMLFAEQDILHAKAYAAGDVQAAA